MNYAEWKSIKCERGLDGVGLCNGAIRLCHILNPGIGVILDDEKIEAHDEILLILAVIMAFEGVGQIDILSGYRASENAE